MEGAGEVRKHCRSGVNCMSAHCITAATIGAPCFLARLEREGGERDEDSGFGFARHSHSSPALCNGNGRSLTTLNPLPTYCCTRTSADTSSLGRTLAASVLASCATSCAVANSMKKPVALCPQSDSLYLASESLDRQSHTFSYTWRIRSHCFCHHHHTHCH